MPGTIIRHYREMKNLTQQFVAKQMGISQNAYSKIENNVTQLTVHHVKQLSKIFEVPIDELLREEFEIHKPLPVGRAVSKAELLERMERLYRKIDAKHTQKSESYAVALSLLLATEHAVALVH